MRVFRQLLIWDASFTQNMPERQSCFTFQQNITVFFFPLWKVKTKNDTERRDEWYIWWKSAILLFTIRCAHKEAFVSRQQKRKEHVSVIGCHNKQTEQQRRRITAGMKQAFFYLPYMRHSHYLNVCHISRDLLNSIYYNVMFGLNGKSMMRQARHRWDHTKAISKLTYGGPMWLILTAVGF